jgi:ATP-binding cassette subfamily F protein 3
MHLLSLVADRLWLVKDGRVSPYEDDLDTYRKVLLQGDDKMKIGRKAKDKAKSAPKPAHKASRDEILALRSEARKCEQRMAKINDMAGKLETKLADPELYNDKPSAVMWQKKYNEVCAAQKRAEELWMGALEKLEKAEKS